VTADGASFEVLSAPVEKDRVLPTKKPAVEEADSFAIYTQGQRLSSRSRHAAALTRATSGNDEFAGTLKFEQVRRRPDIEAESRDAHNNRQARKDSHLSGWLPAYSLSRRIRGCDSRLDRRSVLVRLAARVVLCEEFLRFGSGADQSDPLFPIIAAEDSYNLTLAVVNRAA
jgi:hypothetical protein